MISRYFLHASKNQLPFDNKDAYSPNYNVSPSQLMPVIDMHAPDGLSYFYWGITPEQSKGKAVSAKLINAEKEQLLHRNTYKNALLNRRCIVPMSGFFAWKKIAKKREIPYCIQASDEQILYAAAIWEEYENMQNENIHTFNIITQIELGTVQEVSPVSPIFIKSEMIETWFDKNISNEQIMTVLEQVQPSLKKHSISNKINNKEYNEPDLLKAAPAADQFGNYSLFD